MTSETQTQSIQVTLWEGPGPATRPAVLKRVAAEKLPTQFWENEPYDQYAIHHHDYTKIIFVLKGSITFLLPELNKQILLEIGDRLELPPGVLHGAVVGSDGVQCLEAHKPA